MPSAAPKSKPVTAPKSTVAATATGSVGGKAIQVKKLDLFWFLRDVAPEQNMVINPDVEIAKYKRLVGLVKTQAIIIGVLVCVIILGAPVAQTVYKYHAINPHRDVRNLVPLTGPNLTNEAVLSWATNSTVEILTLGFGDFDRQILSQYYRFTPEGWGSFTKAIRDLDLRTTFKSRQLVLTTVPRDTAVITAQGENADQDYEWHIELPVIMTYMTNNNVSQKQKALIKLTLVRVEANKNSAGIGIKEWALQ